MHIARVVARAVLESIFCVSRGNSRMPKDLFEESDEEEVGEFWKVDQKFASSYDSRKNAEALQRGLWNT